MKSTFSYRDFLPILVLGEGKRVTQGGTGNTQNSCGQSPHTLLLVEDAASVRKLLATILTLNNFDVIEAVNGEEALKKLAGKQPDLILSDILMPIMDGRELLKRLKAQGFLETIPVVMLSADSDAKLERELIGLGAAKLLNKLGSHAELLSSIKEIIRQFGIRDV